MRFSSLIASSRHLIASLLLVRVERDALELSTQIPEVFLQVGVESYAILDLTTTDTRGRAARSGPTP